MSTLLSAAIISLTPHIGYSDSQLDWNVAGGYGPNATPNIISELTYSDIRTLDTGLELGVLFPINDDVALTFEADLTKGKIESGKAQDSDWFGNDRTDEFSRSYAEISGDKLFSYKVGTGLTFAVLDHKLKVSILAGITKSEQFLNVTKGRQAIALGLTPEEIAEMSAYLYEHLNTTFDATWDGYYAGIDTEYKSTFGDFSFRYEAVRTDYDAVADWNLREDFMHPVSFSQEANSKGDRFALSYLYNVNKNIGLGLTLKYEKLETDPGHLKFYHADGFVGSQQLNESNWESRGVNLNFSYKL